MHASISRKWSNQVLSVFMGLTSAGMFTNTATYAADSQSDAIAIIQQQVQLLLKENHQLHQKMTKLEAEVMHTNDRMSRISIGMGPMQASEPFSCGKSSARGGDDNLVMVGSKDGTGCGVDNQNYYRSIFVVVPK